MPDFLSIPPESLYAKLFESVLLIGFGVGLRTFATKILLRQMSQSELRRSWIVTIRNAALIVLLIGLCAIWIDELRTFAASVVLVSVAFVVAMKEFISCLNGSALRAATNAYTVGDRVEIGAFRGDVIDFNLFTTTLLEVGPGKQFHLRTGRTITIPNSKLLDQAVINESFMKQYVLHVFSIPIKADGDWQKVEQVLLNAAELECAPYLEEARRNMELLEKTHGLAGWPVQPRLSLQMPEPGRIVVLVRVPAPVGRQGAIEQNILRRFLTTMNGQLMGSDEAAAETSAAPEASESEPEKRPEPTVVPS